MKAGSARHLVNRHSAVDVAPRAPLCCIANPLTGLPYSTYVGHGHWSVVSDSARRSGGVLGLVVSLAASSGSDPDQVFRPSSSPLGS